LEEKITKELFLSLIHRLHSALWPLSTSDSNNCYESTNGTAEEALNALYINIQNRLNLINPYLSHITQKLSAKKILSNILFNLNCRQSNKIFFYNFVEMILNEIE
jgi:hypothetical protein